jgi:acetoin utilization deacetylase AcuC-like enzyme
MLHVVHHPGYVAPGRSGSTFPYNKYGLLMDALREAGEPFTVHEPEAMPRQWIEAVHDPAYVEEIATLSVPREKERRIGFPITDPVMRRAFLSPGGTWLAARLAPRHGFAANGAGGSHHALADTGAGFCVFNDLAVSAVRLLAEGHARRILIVDLDVHQGDGTAVLLAGHPDIFTFSIHAEKNFPDVKQPSTLDIGLPDDTGDDLYLETLGRT